MCKSWLTVAKELKNEGITPVDTDYERLNEQVEVIKCWKSFLRDLIQTAVEKQKKNVQLLHHKQQKLNFVLLGENERAGAVLNFKRGAIIRRFRCLKGTTLHIKLHRKNVPDEAKISATARH